MSARPSERFKADNILAVYFTRAQGKPFMDVRFFAAPRSDPSITTSFFVPPSTLRAANPGPRFSQGGPANPPQAKPRTLLQRLLGGDLEAGSYSTGDNSLPLREVAKFNFPVLAMDIAVAPADKLPHMVVSDGDQIYMYRIVNQKVEPEWTQVGAQPGQGLLAAARGSERRRPARGDRQPLRARRSG